MAAELTRCEVICPHRPCQSRSLIRGGGEAGHEEEAGGGGGAGVGDSSPGVYVRVGGRPRRPLNGITAVAGAARAVEEETPRLKDCQN